MKKIFHYYVIFLIAAAGLFAESQNVSITNVLESELEAGHISRAEYVAYRLMSITNHADLPQHYNDFQRDESRMGTSLKMEARALIAQSSGAERTLLQSVLYRPDYLPLSKTSPSGRFKLHYTDEGSNAAADTFITQSALAYDEVYDIIINDLGYDPPPIDDEFEPEYDVYVYAVGGYGLTTAEDPAPSDKYPLAYTSFIEMDNTFEHTYTKGIDGMLVTAAHEFFHVVQIGMRSYTISEVPSAWLYEGMAVWMEDYAYDEINDYLQYLPSYMKSLHKSFNTFNGLHEYGTGIFYHMLEQKYGADILKEIWKEFATKELWEALESALEKEASSFAIELTEHMLWNYFTGDRARPDLYYHEGETYPMVEPDHHYEIERTVGFSEQLPALSADYILVEPLTFGNVLIEPKMTSPTHWMYAAINHPVNMDADLVISAGGSSTLFSNVNPANEIFVIPTNVKTPMNGTSDEEYAFFLNLGEITDLHPGIQSIYPNPFQPTIHTNGVRIFLRLAEKTKSINYYILNESGALVFFERLELDSAKSGDFILVWDGTNSTGDFVASGIYMIFVDAGQDVDPAKIAVIR